MLKWEWQFQHGAGKLMAIYKRITIEWSYPIEINSILQKECMNDIGIYYISSQKTHKYIPDLYMA